MVRADRPSPSEPSRIASFSPLARAGVMNGNRMTAQGHGNRFEAKRPQTGEPRLGPLSGVPSNPGPRNLKDRSHADLNKPAVEGGTAAGCY